ncbi:hypothetical protein HBI64_252510 [Parastagonospora nodorum]|nr:hypothetical protein HBI64_252510 [Parastagonospora nodorum]
MADSLRARTLINPSAVLYEQAAARTGFPAEVSNISLRARILINLSAVLYEQSAARPGLSAEVGNMDLDFVPGVAFIPDVHMADSLRARTLINLSAVLYEQAAAQTGLSAEVGNISLRARTLINPSAVLYEQVGIMDLDFVPGVAFDAMGNIELMGDLLGDADRVNNNNNNVAPTPQFSLTALLNLRSLASKRPALSGSDLDRGRTDLTIAGQISLVEQLHNRIKTDEDCKKSTHRQGFNGGSSLELQKTSSDDDDVQLVGDNIEELICVSKVKHTYVLFRRAGNNRNNLNIMVTDPTGREFGRVDMKSSTGLCPLIDGAKANGLIWMGPLGLPFSGLISMTLQLYCKRKWAYDIGKFYKGKNIQLLRPVFELQRYDYYNLQDGDSLTRIQAIDPSFQTNQFTQQGLTPGELGSIYVLRSVDEIRADVADVFDTVVSKSDEVPTRELSSHIKTELLRDNSRKFYRLVITGEDTHCKQTIKKAYIMLLERASLILFMT